MDIEQIVEAGKIQKSCPYYATRKSIASAHVIKYNFFFKKPFNLIIFFFQHNEIK